VNVLVVFTYGYSLKTWDDSGTLSREISIYERLNKDFGINFTFLTFGGENDKKYKFEDIGIKVLPIYTMLKQKNSKFLNYFYSFFIPLLIRNELKTIDLVKQNQLLGSWISLIIKFLYKKPVFIRTGYDMFKFSLEENKSYIVKRLYKILTKFTLKYSDLYTVSSKNDQSFLANSFKLKNELPLRQNWVLKTDYQEFDMRYNNRVLSIGRLEDQKDFSYLISALANKDIILDIIGSGSLRKKLIHEAESRNVSLNLIKNMNNEKLINEIKQYKYFISSSSFEGNPKTLLEAMACGCYVIASDIENHKELIKHNLTGIIYSKNNNELPEIIDSLGRDEVREKIISKNAYEITNEKYSIKKIIDTELQDYKDLLIEDK